MDLSENERVPKDQEEEKENNNQQRDQTHDTGTTPIIRVYPIPIPSPYILSLVQRLGSRIAAGLHQQTQNQQDHNNNNDVRVEREGGENNLEDDATGNGELQQHVENAIPINNNVLPTYGYRLPLVQRLGGLPGQHRRRPNNVIQRNANTNALYNNTSDSDMNLNLPHAYPVSVPVSYPNNNNDNNNESDSDNLGFYDEDEDEEISIKDARSSIIILFIIALVALSLNLTMGFMKRRYNGGDIQQTPEQPVVIEGEKDYDASANRLNDTERIIDDEIQDNSNTSNDNSSTETLDFKEEKEEEVTEDNNCFTNTILIQKLEAEAYLRQEDPSIPRTYVVCPNTTMRIWYFDPITVNYDYSTGDMFPLILFRPNIILRCGNGNVNQNCQFFGGFYQLNLMRRSHFVNNFEALNTTAENITIEGFQFVNSVEGSNIFFSSEHTSLTLKNCVFQNNQNMISSIHISWFGIKTSSLRIENTVFNNNTYGYSVSTYNQQTLSTIIERELIPTTGVIISAPQSSRLSHQISINITKSQFSNSTFNRLPFLMNTTTAAVINLMDPIEKLSITDSNFTGNEGYSSSLVLVGEQKLLWLYENMNKSIHYYDGMDEIKGESNPFFLSGNQINRNRQHEYYTPFQQCFIRAQKQSFPAIEDEEGFRTSLLDPEKGCLFDEFL